MKGDLIIRNSYSKLIFAAFFTIAVKFSAHTQHQAIKVKPNRLIETTDLTKVKGTVTAFDKYFMQNAEVASKKTGMKAQTDSFGRFEIMASSDMRELLRTELVGTRVTDHDNFRVYVRGGDMVSTGLAGNNGAASFILDGIIVENIDFLNPMDVKSETLVKDAAGVGIYGSRGANGVVLINTKL